MLTDMSISELLESKSTLEEKYKFLVTERSELIREKESCVNELRAIKEGRKDENRRRLVAQRYQFPLKYTDFERRASVLKHRLKCLEESIVKINARKKALGLEIERIKQKQSEFKASLSLSLNDYFVAVAKQNLDPKLVESFFHSRIGVVARVKRKARSQPGQSKKGGNHE